MRYNLKYEFNGWDSLFTNPTFDFYFKVTLPKLNKDRIITERDKLGRIVTSEVL